MDHARGFENRQVRPISLCTGSSEARPGTPSLSVSWRESFKAGVNGWLMAGIEAAA